MVILVAVILPHLLPLPFFSFALVIMVMVWLFLKYDQSSFADIGFSFSKFKIRALLYGVPLAIAIVVFTQFVTFPLIDLIFSFPETEVEMYDKVEGDLSFYLLMVVMGWLIGGVNEEIIFRGFIFLQLKKVVAGKYKTQISFLLTSILFGLYHLQLGPADTINAFLAGMAYHLIFMKFKENLWYSIMCHGIYNTIVITLLYLGYL